MNFVLYSDKNYEYMVDYFIKSTIYAKINCNIFYYTVGFESTLNYPNLTKIYFDVIPDKPNLVYYKPNIIKDSLKYVESACYMDSDVILSKRFSTEFFENKELNYPLSCLGPEQYPYAYWTNGIESFSFDDGPLRDYFNIGSRTMGYLWACQISYNRDCADFIEEWLSICENKYLLTKGKILADREYFPFYDETPYNVTFWKRGLTHNLGHRFFNTGKFETFLLVENSNDITNQYLDNLYGLVQDSNLVGFYHGFKDREELDKVIGWMQNN